MNLQQLIADTQDYGTLDLEFDEYYGKIEIDRPIVINGQGSTICARQGPVVTILSENVRLNDVRLEVTETSNDDPDAGLALLVKDDIRVQFNDVVVKGNVKGVVLEDGDWEYPETLHIWPVASNRKNYFTFNIRVPVSCSLETDIDGLRILNPGLRKPGRHKIRLEVEPLKPNTILFGQIEIKSTYLTRMIPISGGTYGAPDTIAEPNPEKPVELERTIQPHQAPKKKIPEPPPPTPKPSKRSKIWLYGIIGLIIIATCLWGYYYLFPHSAKKDVTLPSGEVRGIRETYQQGDEVRCSLYAQDDTQLHHIAFVVKKTSINEQWDYKNPSATHKLAFSTQKWKPGKFEYLFTITDQAQNVQEVKGSFNLKPKPDESKPWGDILGVKTVYRQDDQVRCILKARDNQALIKMVLQVLGPTGNEAETETWNLNGTEAQRHFSFSTQKQPCGKYTCSLQIFDAAGNTENDKAHFELKAKAVTPPTPTPSPTELAFSEKRSLICRALISHTSGADKRAGLKAAERRIATISKNHLEKAFADLSGFQYQLNLAGDDAISILTNQKNADGKTDIIAQVDYTFLCSKEKRNDLLKDARLPLKVMIQSGRHQYKNGEKIVFDFRSNRDFYGCIISIEPNGDIIQFLPNLKRTQSYFKGGQMHHTPDFDQGDRMELQVMPPFGESVIILAGSTIPLNLSKTENYAGDFNVFKKSEKLFLREIKRIKNLAPDSCAEFYEARWHIQTSE